MTKTPLISVPEALRRIKTHRFNADAQWLGLKDCDGRILAEAVKARTTLPPADVSAMDGYAVRLSDLSSDNTALTVIGEAPAGSPFDGKVDAGQAVRIFTGALMPDGTDHVVIQENTSREHDTVIIHPAQKEVRHVRKGGIDFHNGQTVLDAGRRLGPAEIAVAAAANVGRLPVQRRPKVALLACGDELRRPGSDLKPGQIVNSNAYALTALLRRWGAEPMDMGILPDDPDAIIEAIESVSDADILVPIGGASVGDHDHMRHAFGQAGAEMVFEKIAVKPGKPTWLASLGQRKVLGLPGNPASAYVCAHLFLRPLLGSEETDPLLALKAGCDLPPCGPRETYLRAQRDSKTVTPLPNQDSSLLTPFLKADVLIRRGPDAPAIKKDDILNCVPLSQAD